MRSLSLTIAAVLALVQPAMARSMLEDFERKVARYAPTTDVAGTKVLCACQGESQPTGATGRLVQIRAVNPTTRHVKVACHQFVTLTK